MKTVIHVNQANIRANKKNNNQALPAISIKTYQSNRYGKTVVITGEDGLEVARIVYRPDKPLSCGAKCWIETFCRVNIIE